MITLILYEMHKVDPDQPNYADRNPKTFIQSL